MSPGDAQEICRELGIATGTFYTWKRKYSGMEVSHLKRLKELEEENRKLKQMYADAASTAPSGKIELIGLLQKNHPLMKAGLFMKAKCLQILGVPTKLVPG